MVRQRLAGFDYANPDVAFHVTIRACPGKTPFVDSHVAQMVVEALDGIRKYRGVTIFSYALMPDHLHLLMRLGNDQKELGRVIGAFKMHTTKQYWKLGFEGMLWQQRFHDHIVRRSESGL